MIRPGSAAERAIHRHLKDVVFRTPPETTFMVHLRTHLPAIREMGGPRSLEGVRQLVRRWAKEYGISDERLGVHPTWGGEREHRTPKQVIKRQMREVEAAARDPTNRFNVEKIGRKLGLSHGTVVARLDRAGVHLLTEMRMFLLRTRGQHKGNARRMAELTGMSEEHMRRTWRDISAASAMVSFARRHDSDVTLEEVLYNWRANVSLVRSLKGLNEEEKSSLLRRRGIIG